MNTKKTKNTSSELEPRPGAERQRKFVVVVVWAIVGALVLSVAAPALVSLFI